MSASISSKGRRWPSLVYRVTGRSLDRGLAAGFAQGRREIGPASGVARLNGDVREVLGGQRLAVALQRGTEEHARQLAHVARPAIADENRQCVIADRQGPEASLVGQAIEEMSGKSRDVAAAVAQRRQHHRRRADPLGEARMEIVRQRMAARRNDADIDRLAAIETDWPDLARRENAIQGFLRCRRKRADLIEQQRSGIGLNKLAHLRRKSPREGALLVSEQFAVDDVGRESPCSRARASGPLARRLAAWIARATVSLPVPGSPMIRIGNRLRAPLAATASDARNCGAAPTSCSSESGASFSETGASSPAALRRSEFAASASSSRSGATGRTRKSDAPARIASTAVETVSLCEMTMTGSFSRFSRSVAIRAGPCSASQLPISAARMSRPCGPWSTATAASSSAAPTTLQTAREAMAEISRRSSTSVSRSNRQRVGSSRIAAQVTGEGVNSALRALMPEVQDLGSASGVVMDRPAITHKGKFMAHEEEPLLASPPTQEVATHVRDYEKFTRMMKWGAIVCLIIGFIVLLIFR